MPVVCAHFGCNGAYSYPGTPAITADAQAVGGTDCAQAYTGYTSGVDLNPPGFAAKTFRDSRRKYDLLTIQCGVNGFVHGRTAAQEYASIVSLVQAAQADGFTVFVATITDSCLIYQSAGAEATFRDALNTAIRNGAAMYGYTVVDYAADPDIGSAGSSLNATYYQLDVGACSPIGGVHLTATGVAIQASLMEAAMTGIGFPQ